MATSTLSPELLALALLDGELKTLKSIAERCPRQDGTDRLGVSSGTAWQWISRGNLVLDTVNIDGATFYHVPVDEQHRPDWGLGSRFKKRRVGRPSHQDLLLQF